MTPKLNHLMVVIAIASIYLLASAPSYAQDDPLAVVHSYQLLHNHEDVERTMALFTEDATFEMIGQGTLTGEVLRALHEYDTALDTRLAFINCEVDANVVTCQTVEFNAWLETAGLQPIFYPSTVFTIDGDKISKISSTMSPESAQAIGETLAAFVPWLMEKRPDESAPLFTAEGQFIYSRENGELVVQLLAEWRTETAE